MAMLFWANERHTKLEFIQPSDPALNAFVESLSGKFRNVCLTQYWLRSLVETRREINQWQAHYNPGRPHISLGYLSPVAFVRQGAYSE
jgi:putative transposase